MARKLRVRNAHDDSKKHFDSVRAISAQTSAEKPKPPPPISVCSDVHLGTRYSETEHFYKWLRARRPDETVVLLGDILDYWLFNRNDTQGTVVNRFIEQWRKLVDELRPLHQQGTTFHFVPGNHDAFVFFAEAPNTGPWGQELLKRSDGLRWVRAQTEGWRMTSVASVHYPFLQLKVAEQQILFTHGHYDSWYWRAISSIENLERDDNLFLTSIAIAAAHKYSRRLRFFNNKMDLRKIHKIEDEAISITNAVVRAQTKALQRFGGTSALATANRSTTADIIDHALSYYFEKTPAPSGDEMRLIEDALKALGRIQGRAVQEDMAAIWTNTMGYLRHSVSGKSIRLDCIEPKGGIHPTTIKFRDFLNADRLVVGHHHKPREVDPSYDAGGFVTPIKTGLVVCADGSIAREP